MLPARPGIGAPRRRIAYLAVLAALATATFTLGLRIQQRSTGTPTLSQAYWVLEQPLATSGSSANASRSTASLPTNKEREK